MKISSFKMLILGTCLQITMLIATEIRAQATKNVNFEAGIAAIEVENMPLAYKSFLTAAKQGHIDSQFNLGVMNEQGIGTAKNDKDAPHLSMGSKEKNSTVLTKYSNTIGIIA